MGRLTRRTLRLGCLLLGVGMGLGGCVRDDPAFLASDLVAAPTLVGTWEGKGTKGEKLVLTVTEAEQPLEDGRVMARLIDGKAQQGATGSAPVYHFHVESTPAPGLHVDPAAGGAGLEGVVAKASVIDARVYVLKGVEGANEPWIACLQFEPRTGEPERKLSEDPFEIRFNAHLLLGVRVKKDGASGDRLSILMPTVAVTLSPTIKLLDPPVLESAQAASPAMEAALKLGPDGKAAGGLLLTNDPDRALGVYRRYAQQPGFWQSESVELRRR